MKRKKIGFIAAMTAVLLITAVLVTTCMDEVNKGDLEDFKYDYTPSPGKGFIALRTAHARTLLPTSLGITALTDFDEIDILIVDSTNPLLNFNELGLDPSADFASGDYIEVDPGTYNVTVLGYKDRGPAGTPNLQVAAAGSHVGTVTVAPSTGGTATVILTEVTAPVGGTTYNGNFIYNLTLPAATTGTMTFTSLSGTTPPGAISLSAGANGPTTVLIPAGYYRVFTALTSSGRQPITYIETVYIWAGHDTSWTRTFNTLNNISYNVTYYDWDDDDFTAKTPTTAVTHGGTLTLPAATAPTTSSTYTKFDGWWTADITNPAAPVWGIQWTIARQVLRDGLELFAKWSLPSWEQLVINVTVSISAASGNAPVLSATSEAALNSSGIIVIDITDLGGGTFTEWRLQGTPLADDGDAILIDSTTHQLTYDFNKLLMSNIAGTQIFTCLTSNGSAEVTLNFTYNPIYLP